NGDGPPNTAANTRSKVGIWPGSDTIVASAQARSSATVVAPMTDTARASRSQRSGPTGSPASCRAMPNPVAIAATSGSAGATTASVNAPDHRRQARPAHALFVFRIFQDRTKGLPAELDAPVAGQTLSTVLKYPEDEESD